MVKYYITYLRLTIVSAVIGSLEIETMCIHVWGWGGGGVFHESWKFQSFNIAKNSRTKLDGNRSIKGKLSVF